MDDVYRSMQQQLVASASSDNNNDANTNNTLIIPLGAPLVIELSFVIALKDNG